MDTTFSADQIVDKILWLAKPAKTYSAPRLDSQVIEDLPAGQSVGRVYSYVTRPDGVWWMFKFSNGGFFYIKHEKGLFDYQKLIDQFPADEPAQAFAFPVWASVGLAAFAIYKSQQETKPLNRNLWLLGGMGLGAFTLVKNVLQKVDFNPFD